MLIVFGGLPGTGKSTLSRELARRLGAAWLRIDAIEAAMWRAGFAPAETGLAAYVLAHAIADAQLGLGLTVVADAVNPVEAARRGWRDLAAAHGVALRVIEVVCSSRTEHRRRVESRAPAPDQLTLPTWDDVVQREYEPWAEPRLTVDTMAGQESCLPELLAYCKA
jgi:predicted kinase